jgi:hypothetical protein
MFFLDLATERVLLKNARGDLLITDRPPMARPTPVAMLKWVPDSSMKPAMAAGVTDRLWSVEGFVETATVTAGSER